MADQQQQATEIPDLSQLSLVQFTINDEIRDKCRRLCSEYLSGPWSFCKRDEVLVEAIEDGLSNRSYTCTNLKLTAFSESTLKADVPSKVIVRLHGSELVGDQGDMIAVSKSALPIMCEILHQKGLAAKIYGIFDEGRIEHFIESTKFTQDSWDDQQLIDCIIRKMVEIHQLEMPISKDPWSLVKMAEKFYIKGKDNPFLKIELYDPDLRPMVQRQLDYDHVGIAKWLKDMEPYIKSPCVYCHNDLHFGNILNRTGLKSIDDQVFIIDYDNSSYGFRGYDINLFMFMKTFLPSKPETWGKVKIPTIEEKREAIKVYLNHLTKVRGGKIDPEKDTLEHIAREVDFCSIMSSYVFNAFGMAKMNPIMAPIFKLMMDNTKDSEREEKLAMERCNEYKRQYIEQNGPLIN